MKPFLSWLGASSVAILTCLAAEDGKWTPLFNGTDLTGWAQHSGKAKYFVENGELVGETVANTPNSFLCTTRTFHNFILELDFKPTTGLNSGVQIRSECFAEPKTAEVGGKSYKFPADRVHGYQVEIDPSDRAWTGGIYDEARRGWLVDLKNNEPARKAFKANEWNHFRIECRGDSIKTWLNGVPAADLKDSVTPVGFIALQVHAVGNKQEKLQIHWRNIRLQELP